MKACQWEIALVQVSTPENQSASAIDHAGYITNFTENRASKSFFSWRLKRDAFFNFCVCHKKGVSGKHPIHKTNTYYIFFKGILGKTSSYNIYPFPTVYTRLWKHNNDCFQFSGLHLFIIIIGARWSMICSKCCKDVWNL